MKIVLSLLVIGLVAGCATQRPQMPDDRYQGFARTWATITHCNAKGWIDADTAARGRTYVGSAVNSYTFDEAKMRQTIASLGENSPPSQEVCRDLAMNIQARKQQIDVQNSTAEMQQRESQNTINAARPTQTYCNKVGTQVLCNSY